MVENPPANAGNVGDVGLIPGLERSPGEGNGSLFQGSCLKNPVDRGAWRNTVHGVTELSNIQQPSIQTYMMVCPHHSGVVQSFFTALKFLFVPLTFTFDFKVL